MSGVLGVQGCQGPRGCQGVRSLKWGNLSLFECLLILGLTMSANSSITLNARVCLELCPPLATPKTSCVIIC